MQLNLRTKLGFTRNLQKCNSDFMKKSRLAAERRLCIAIALPVARFFGMVWTTLASMWENLMYHCLHLVRASLIALRCGITAVLIFSLAITV